MVSQSILSKLKKGELPPTKIDTTGYSIDPVAKRNGILACRKLGKELGLDYDAPKVVITGTDLKKGIIGTDSASIATIGRYMRCLDGFQSFCIEHRDDISGIILDREECPANPPAINRDTFLNYINEKEIIGTHMLRKTAHLLAYWGSQRADFHPLHCEVNKSPIQVDARHNTADQTATYLSDGGAMFLIAKLTEKNKLNKARSNKVGLYKPIFVKKLDSFRRLNTGSDRFKSIRELADWYIFDCCALKPAQVDEKGGIYDLFNVVCSYKPAGSKEAEQELREFAEAELEGEKLAFFKAKLDEAMNQRLQEVPNNPMGVVEQGSKSKGAETSTGTKPLSAKNPKAKEMFSFSQPFQNEYAQAETKMEKLQLLCDSVEEGKARGKKVLNNADRGWLGRCSRVYSCLHECFDADKERFVNEIPSLSLKDFRCPNDRHKSRAILR